MVIVGGDVYDSVSAGGFRVRWVFYCRVGGDRDVDRFFRRVRRRGFYGFVVCFFFWVDCCSFLLRVVLN